MKNFTFFTFSLLFLGVGITKAQITNLYYFTGTNGEYPHNSVTVSANGKVLYGMVTDGGANADGGVFSIDTNGTHYKDILDFNGTNGSFPHGALTLIGSTLYGMTNMGGKNGKGCIFSIDTNSSGYTDIWDFDDTGSNGANPSANLTLSGSVFYGMTTAGGRSQDGNIFSINTNGTGYTDLYDFTNSKGQYPYGSLTLSGTVLYGMAYEGGANNWGVIFSINTNGTGYTDLHDFDITDGKYPYGSLTLVGSVLYGAVSQGAVNGDGCIFSINTNGTMFTDMHDFNVTDGNGPQGDLLLSGSTLCGLAPDGGSGSGTLFMIHTNGSGFSSIDMGGTNARYPYGSLAISGNKFYGMSENGGTFFGGNVFGCKTTVLGIDEVTATSGKINVYPNPSNGVFTVALSHPELVSGSQTIEVYNVLGEQVYNGMLKQVQHDYQIDLSSQPNGIYLYRVIANSGELIGEGKLVIQK